MQNRHIATKLHISRPTVQLWRARFVALRLDLPQPAALLFDLDGTLVDTVQRRIEAWLEALAGAGVVVDRDRVGFRASLRRKPKP